MRGFTLLQISCFDREEIFIILRRSWLIERKSLDRLGTMPLIVLFL